MRTRDALLFLVVAATVASCGGSSGAPAASSPVATAFCDKVEVCDGQPLSPADRQTCRRLASMAFAIPPDPDTAVACLTNASCSDLMADPEGVTNACLDIDPSSYQCNGDSLHLCTNQGVCNDVDCRAVCAQWGYSFDSCGLSSADGFDQCLCR